MLALAVVWRRSSVVLEQWLGTAIVAAALATQVSALKPKPLLRRLQGPAAGSERVVLEGTPEQIAGALRRVEGSGLRVRR